MFLNLKGALILNMSNKKEKIETPKIPAYLEPFTLSDYELEDEQILTDGSFQDCEITNQTGYKVCFDRMRFTNTTFRGISLNKAEFTDVIFENCDLSNINLNESIFHRVVFNKCKLLGMDLSGSTLRNVVFDTCYADYVVLRFANAKLVKLMNSSFAKADFFNMNISSIIFEEINLDQTQFSQTKLAGIDLSSCEFESLVASLEDLQGCIISPMQAAVFASLFGLVVNRD